MKFSVKVFAAIFSISASVLLISEIAVLRIMTSRARLEYAERYRTFSDQLGESVREIDKTTDFLVVNALRAFSETDRREGLMSNERLLQLQSRMGGIGNLYQIDRRGNFARSDWYVLVARSPELRAHYGAAPKLKPLFQYCKDYEKLFTGGMDVAKTPIIISGYQKLPYKFLMIPNHDRTRILQADMPMKFITENLQNVMAPDVNVVSIGLFAPNGEPLGYVRTGASPAAPTLDPAALASGGPTVGPSSLTFYTKVLTPNGDCCECRTKGLTAPGDPIYYYILRTEVSLAALNRRIAEIRASFLWLGLALLVFSGLVALLLSRRLVERLEWMGERVGEIARSNDFSRRLNMSGSDEVVVLANRFDAMMEQLERSRAEMAEAERDKAFSELAHQVAHDIRSPLAALDTVIKDLSQVPEDYRLMIRGAGNRIRDIAANLLSQHRAASVAAAPATQRSACLLSGLMDSIIAEKRLEYRARGGVEIEARLEQDAYGLFARVQPTEFKRMLSNLIGNGVEALAGGRGSVRLSLHARDGRVFVEVADDGRGIDPEVLPRLGRKGESHGKPDGSGLGLHHARACAESWGGALEIASVPGKGSTVTVSLPQEPAPDWFVSELVVAPGQPVVVLDDDTSIHAIWRGRFDSPQGGGSPPRLTHLSTPDEFRSWVGRNPETAKSSLLLLDYELLGFEETGLSLAAEAGLGENVVLVTSHDENPEIIAECRRLKARLIPKGLAGLVPIKAPRI